MNTLLEIACFNLESLKTAQAAGANRIELCTNYVWGGVSPDEKTIGQARSICDVPLHVIIRPRGGNFVYNKSELKKMKTCIQVCIEQAVDGIVLGVLKTDNSIDEELLNEFKEISKPLHITFHRAVDACTNIDKAFEILIKHGINSVLSSGGTSNAIQGMKHLNELQKKYGSNIQIIAGGGIRSNTILEIHQTTGILNFHSAAITDLSENTNFEEILKLKQILSEL